MKIKIGTRKSKLALVQTDMFVKKLKEKYPEIETEIVHISTKGDKILDKPLMSIGGKGVFVSEIESALQKGIIDIAVHSAKDLPVFLAEGLEISAVLERGNYRDVLVTKKNKPIKNKKEYIIGTSSIRRIQNMKSIYYDVSFKDIRGNVDTRLKKLENDEYNGIILAAAGLERLGLDNDSRFEYKAFDYTEFLSSPCQGIIAVESRKYDDISDILKSVSDKDTFTCFEIERFIVNQLQLGCGVPLGAYSFIENGKINISVSGESGKVFSGSDIAENRFNLAKELILCL